MTHPVGARVLVVDDTDAMRALMRRILTGAGYRVDVAASVSEARALNPSGYDAVLIDAHLGDERGVVLIEELQAGNPAAARQCLLVTGGGAGVTPDGAAYLAKPFSGEELLTAVRALERPDPDDRLGSAPGAADSGNPGASAVTPKASATSPETAVPHEPAAAPRDPAAGPCGPAAGRPAGWQLLSLVGRLRTRERTTVADYVHDRFIQELTAAMLSMHALERHPPGDLAPYLQPLRQQLGAAARSARQLIDDVAPGLRTGASLQTGASLPDAVRWRTAWLSFSSLSVDVQYTRAVAGHEASVIVDVIELVLFLMAENRLPGSVDAVVRAEESVIEILLTHTWPEAADEGADDPAAVQAALMQLAGALGGSAHVSPGPSCWQAGIRLPRAPTTLAGHGR